MKTEEASPVGFRNQPDLHAPSVINARGVKKAFESGDGIRHLDLDVPPSTIFGFIGPSGSGKTTTVRMLTGALAPSRGQLRVLGVTPMDFDSGIRSRIGYMPQLSVLYPEMTVEENLRFFSALYGIYGKLGKKRMRDALEFVELDTHSTKRVNEISGGMRRRLSLAACLSHNPDLVFLDEPTAGIDPVLRRRLWEHFSDLRNSGRTLFITTQYVGEAAYCDLVGVIADGELIHVDSPRNLRRLAKGGDVVHLDLDGSADIPIIERAMSQIGPISMAWLDSSTLEVVVRDAGATIPKMSKTLSDAGIVVKSIGEQVPDFDDVFIALIEGHRLVSEKGSG